MRWLQTEYILKGIYLGLVLYAALLLSLLGKEASWWTLLEFNGIAVAGVAAALVVAAALKLRDGYRPHGRPLAFLTFLLLESPLLVYAGVLAGVCAGTVFVAQQLKTHGLESLPQFGDLKADDLVWPTVGGGALLGVVLGLLRHVRNRNVRLSLILILGGAVVGVILYWFHPVVGEEAVGKTDKNPTVFAAQLLLGLPLFYLLTFSGHHDESEVEIGAMCATLGVGLGILTGGEIRYQWLVLLAPLVLYLWYTLRVLPGLRVLKHAFRGLSHSRIGRHRRALLAFRRALHLDPQHRLARAGFWEVHRSLDLEHLSADRDLVALLDFELCLERAGSLLTQGRPAADQKKEAAQLLDLVVSQRADLKPAVDYWRAVLLTHDGRLDEAAVLLERLLDPNLYGAASPQRQQVLFPAWQLALLLHPGLRQRVGDPQLALPGRRLEAIAAVERHLAAQRDDGGALDLKQFLYLGLTEAEYLDALGVGPNSAPPTFANAEAGVEQAAAAAPEEAPAGRWTLKGLYERMANGAGVLARYAGLGRLLGRTQGPLPYLDYAYCRQLGLERITDAEQWRRGAEFLRIAADGLPANGPTLFVEIAKAYQRNLDDDDAARYFVAARQAGRAVGVANLEPKELNAYFATVKYLAELALFKEDLDGAAENYRLLLEAPNVSVESYRTLADISERKGDPLNALRYNETALIYSPKDRDLLARKDRYYYSVLPEQLRAHLEAMRASFDFEYCLNRARLILDNPAYGDPEWLDVAAHLTELAAVIDPASVRARLLQARVLLRRGERDAALALLEKVRDPRPESFPSHEDEDAWFQAQQVLGDLYMEMGKPELAIPCFSSFRESHRSGAKTVFKMGQAYEQLGDTARAARCYKLVTGYEGNPLVWEAREALARLQAG